MQQLTSRPRNNLTDDQVRSVLTASSVAYNFGIDVIDDAGNVLLTPPVSKLTVKMDSTAKVLGTVQATVGYRPAVTDRWRPWLKMTANGIETVWWLGVYLPETPEAIYGSDVPTWSALGYDYLSALDRPIPRPRDALSSSSVFAAINSVLSDSGFPAPVLLDSAREDAVMDQHDFWPADGKITWADVLNDLLGCISYRAPWMDWSGRLRLGPYRKVEDRPAGWDFDVGNLAVGISTDDPKITRDVYKHPNKWVFVAKGIAGSPIENVTQYTANNLDRGESSQQELGKTNEAPEIVLSAASFADLKLQGQAYVDRHIRATEVINMTSRLFPMLWLDDVATYSLAAWGTNRIVCQEWALVADGAGQMSSTWEVAQ